MTLISKATGALSLVSCVHDIHKSALIYSKNKYARVSSDSTIENSIRYQKANNLSYKDTQRKNWLDQGNFLTPIKEGFAKVTGYIEGAFKTSLRYIPNFVLATIALIAGKTKDGAKDHSKLANLAALGLGIIEAIDFVVNGLGVNQRDDYLK